MKTITVLLLATLLYSCGSLPQDRIDEEFEVYAQSMRAERDVYKLALENCYNK